MPSLAIRFWKEKKTRRILVEVALSVGCLSLSLLEMDNFLWRLCRNLDVIRGRALRRLDPHATKLPARPPNVKAHPAIFEFLHSRVTFEEP